MITPRQAFSMLDPREMFSKAVESAEYLRDLADEYEVGLAEADEARQVLHVLLSVIVPGLDLPSPDVYDPTVDVAQIILGATILIEDKINEFATEKGPAIAEKVNEIGTALFAGLATGSDMQMQQVLQELGANDQLQPLNERQYNVLVEAAAAAPSFPLTEQALEAIEKTGEESFPLAAKQTLEAYATAGQLTPQQLSYAFKRDAIDGQTYREGMAELQSQLQPEQATTAERTAMERAQQRAQAEIAQAAREAQARSM